MVCHWLVCLNAWYPADGCCFCGLWNLWGGFSGRTGLPPPPPTTSPSQPFFFLIAGRMWWLTRVPATKPSPPGWTEPKKPSPLKLSLVSNQKHNQQSLYYIHWWKAETVQVFSSNIPWEEGGKGWMKGQCFGYEPLSLIWLLTVLQMSFGSAS